jgi:hypothetical protein
METSSRSTECFRLAWADPTMRRFVSRSVSLLRKNCAQLDVDINTQGYLFLGKSETHARTLAQSFCAPGDTPRLRQDVKSLRNDYRLNDPSVTGVDLLASSAAIDNLFQGNLTGGRGDLFGVHMREGLKCFFHFWRFRPLLTLISLSRWMVRQSQVLHASV